MRRIDRAVTDNQQITFIIEQAKVVHIGMIDNDRPYVVPMQYGFIFNEGKLTLYVHCAKEGRKLDILKKNPCVFIELETNVAIVSGGDVPCKYGSEYASVMGDGTAFFVEDVKEKIIISGDAFYWDKSAGLLYGTASGRVKVEKSGEFSLKGSGFIANTLSRKFEFTNSVSGSIETETKNE